MNLPVKSNDVSGILLFDKPEGISSHDAVYILRRKLGIKRIGHGGTLDPMATGLLVMLVGKATKAQSFLQDGNKVYSGTIQFGKETDTWDKMGKTLFEAGIPLLNDEAVKEAIKPLNGNILQQVPPFSAVKHKGEKLYNLARKGKEVPVIMRQVYVNWLEYKILSPDSLYFKIECSGCTYIRTIARDFGLALKSRAHLTALRRLSVGKFNVEDAITDETLKAASEDDVKSRLFMTEYA